MKRLLMLISLVFLCCFTVGCISRDEAATADVEADIQAIKDNVALCANNAETPYPCYISVEGRDEKEDGKKSNGYGGSRGGDPDDEWRRA
jgi:hypothetical protein